MPEIPSDQPFVPPDLPLPCRSPVSDDYESRYADLDGSTAEATHADFTEQHEESTKVPDEPEASSEPGVEATPGSHPALSLVEWAAPEEAETRQQVAKNKSFATSGGGVGKTTDTVAVPSLSSDTETEEGLQSEARNAERKTAVAEGVGGMAMEVKRGDDDGAEGSSKDEGPGRTEENTEATAETPPTADPPSAAAGAGGNNGPTDHPPVQNGEGGDDEENNIGKDKDNRNGENAPDDLSMLEATFEPSTDHILGTALLRWSERVDSFNLMNPDAMEVPVHKGTQLRAVYNNLRLKVVAEPRLADISLSGVAIGHYNVGEGAHVFYPELIAQEDVPGLTPAVQKAYQTMRAIDQERHEKNGTVFFDPDDPTFRGVTHHQQEVLKETELAERMVHQNSMPRDPLLAVHIDPASTYHLRFVPATYGSASGEPGSLLFLEIQGATNPLSPGRFTGGINLARMQGADPSSGYSPNVKVISTQDYNRYIAPLVDEMLQAEHDHPNLSFKVGPPL